MDPLRDQPWWCEFVEQLRNTPLDTLAQTYGASPSDLEAALATEPIDTAGTDAAWWPEVVRRVHHGESIRATARAFGTNPRRIRRGLARAGLRVGGVEVPEVGLAALAEFGDRLGEEPDGLIAELAGVTVEAVQGERRRRSIAPFRPTPRAKPVRAAKPRTSRPTSTKIVRNKAWLTDDIPQVVRRNGIKPRGGLGRMPTLGDREPARRMGGDAALMRSLPMPNLPGLKRVVPSDSLPSPQAPKRRVRVKRPAAVDDPH